MGIVLTKYHLLVLRRFVPLINKAETVAITANKVDTANE